MSQRQANIHLLLEYGVLGDIECWDVRELLSDPHQIAAIEEKLHSSFASNPKFIPYRIRCEAERILLYAKLPSLNEGDAFSRFLTQMSGTSARHRNIVV